MAAFKDNVAAAVDGVTSYPDRAKDPVLRVVERVANVANIAVTGPDDPAVLLAYADGLAKRLKADPSIAQVALGGVSDREIRIELGADALRRHGLTLADISAVLARHSLDMPAGTMEGAAVEAAIRFLGERRSPAELAAIPVAGTQDGGDLRLGDIARIETGFSDPAQAALFNGKRAVLITVSKTPQQDALRVKAAVERQVGAARAEAPGDITLTIAQDSTENIRERLRILGENGLKGLALVLVVMWLFFGLRVSFWVAMGLPVSFLGAIFAMQMLGYTINMITMVALLVAVGLLMDDAIVIAENIVRRRQTGESALEATVNGVAQVGPGVIASFLTTLCIVGPLGFITGNIGAILKYIPVVLVIVLAVSIIEAFLILPHHMKGALDRPMTPGRMVRAVNAGADGLRDRVIVPLARLALRHRYLTVGLAGFLVLASVAPYSGGLIKYQSFPALESDTVEARLLLVQGTPLARTQDRVTTVAAALEALNAELAPAQPDGQPLVQSVTISYGVNADTPESGPHMATVSARLLPTGVRTTEVSEILDRWRQLTGPMPDMAAFRITDRERGAGGRPIDLRVQGDDLAALEATARELRAFFSGFAGVREVTYDLHPGKPEYIVTMKPSAAAALGVTARDIAEELRAAFRGDTGLELRDGIGPLAIVARLSTGDRASAADLAEIRIKGPGGALIALTAVAEIRESRGYASLHRIDGLRTVSVQGAINPEVANASELMQALKAEFLPALRERDPYVQIAILGEAEDTATTGASLARNLGLGLIGVYLILAFLFGSFVQPLIVFAAIPLSLVGAVWGHVALGLQLSLPSLVGIATLAGVVVNGSILLVGFIKDRQAAGADDLEAAIGAVQDRFRAILLTALTTVAGLAPLLLEPSSQAQFLRPMVASLAFGLTSATMLALFVTPALFLILSDLGRLRRNPHESRP